MKADSTNDPVLRGRIFFHLCLLAFFAGVGIVRAQQVDVRPAVTGSVAAKPGSIVAVGIRIQNKSTTSYLLKSRIVLPEGWRTVIRDFPFELQPGMGDVRLISISVPSDAPAKRYAITYALGDSSGTVGSTTFQVVVPPVAQLQLEVQDAPRYVIAGHAFTTTFILSNAGNSATAIRLRSRSSADFPVRLDSTTVHLGPRETRQLTVRVLTIEQSEKVSHTLELEATSGIDSTLVRRASSVVEIVSHPETTHNDFYSYPVTIRLGGVGQDGLFGAQAEAAGSSSLNEQHTDKLEFLFRAPETQTKSVFGQRDAYDIAYHASGYDVYGGDMNYALSTLTEYGRYATGGGGRFTTGGLSAGGFYNYNRWSAQHQTEQAGFASYNVLANASVGVNYIRKDDLARNDIATVRGLVSPLTGSTLDLEYGQASKDGKQDDAFSLRLNGNRPWIGYDVRYIHAGPNFAGYYQDIDFLSASANVQVTANLRLESYLRRETRNLSRDTLQLYAPDDQFYQIGAGYSDIASLYYLHTVHQDDFPNPQYKRGEDALQGRIGFNARSVSLYLDGGYGLTRDDLLGQSYSYERAALNAGIRPKGNQSYSISLEYTNGQDVYTNVDQERLSASLDVWMLLGQGTQVQVDAYVTRLNTVPVQLYSLAEGSIEHVFPFGHSVRFRVRESILSTVLTTYETAYALDYSIPFGVPIKRITAVGQLSGSVTDENGKGLANILVNAGSQAALTGKDGEYQLSSLPPGPVFVTVDQATIGLDHITTRSMPVEVDIVGGEEAHLDIGVTRSVAVTGTVKLFDSKDPVPGDTTTSAIDRGGRSGVFLELSNGTDVNRRVSDNHGRFSFTDIRPGSWTLSVIGGDIPEYHVVVPDSVTVHLAPGQKKDVTIELRPKRRVIRMLEEGAVIQAVPAPIQKKEETVPAKKKVEPAPVPPKTIQPCIVSYDPRRKGYILQISSWVTQSKALRVAKFAERISGMKSFTVTVRLAKLGKRSRVFLSLFPTRKSAEDMCAKFRANE